MTVKKVECPPPRQAACRRKWEVLCFHVRKLACYVIERLIKIWNKFVCRIVVRCTWAMITLYIDCGSIWCWNAWNISKYGASNEQNLSLKEFHEKMLFSPSRAHKSGVGCFIVCLACTRLWNVAKYHLAYHNVTTTGPETEVSMCVLLHQSQTKNRLGNMIIVSPVYQGMCAAWNSDDACPDWPDFGRFWLQSH